MKTALAFWRGTTAPAALRSTHERPGAINWTRISLLSAIWTVLAVNLASPFVATAQNLGTSPQFGQAVQGQQATTVEGTVLNIVNWGCNVIAPVIAIACLGVAGWHFKSGRGYLGWGVTEATRRGRGAYAFERRHHHQLVRDQPGHATLEVGGNRRRLRWRAPIALSVAMGTEAGWRRSRA
jgi:hypothetical protein